MFYESINNSTTLKLAMEYQEHLRNILDGTYRCQVIL